MDSTSTAGDVNPIKRRHGADDTKAPYRKPEFAKEQPVAGATETTTSVVSGTAGAVSMAKTEAGVTTSSNKGGKSRADAGTVSKEKACETASI